MTLRFDKLWRTEDWWAVWVGLLIFVLSLGALAGVDLLGWAAKFDVWRNAGKALRPVSADYGGLPGLASLALTYVCLLALLSFGARALRADVGRFAAGFSVIFWASAACLFLGHYAYIAATPDKQPALGIGWSLNLTGEAGYILALIAGLLIGNFWPALSARLAEATRPEWFIKTAIVIMGAALGVKAAQATGLTAAIVFRGLCAIVEAYLIYWALVYFIARRYFGFSREWAAPSPPGIIVCESRASPGRRRARGADLVKLARRHLRGHQLVLLPFLAQHFLHRRPMVAGAWMGLAVRPRRSGGHGAITDALIAPGACRRWHRFGGLHPDGDDHGEDVHRCLHRDLIVHLVIWCARIEPAAGQRVGLGQIWGGSRFVLGCVLTFAVLLGVVVAAPVSPPA
jgi:hypothetical protein